MGTEPPGRTETATAIRAMLAIVAIAFVAEAIIIAGLDGVGFSHHTPLALVLETGILAVLIAPPIYWLVLNPLRREYEKRLAAETRAEDMTRLAITDALTRIMNRRGITVSLLDAMAQAERYATPLAVAMADIDHFKRVNDEYGHEAGDKVLTEIAGILADALRMPDKVGRYGGEEFLIVLPHTALTQARKISDRIRAAVAEAKFDVGNKQIPLTISIGVTQFSKGEDLEQLISRTDAALYAAKQGGRNLVVAKKPR